MAGTFIMAFAAILAIPTFLAALGGSKIAVLLVILREGRGRYREQTKEGKLSQHYDVTIAENSDPMGQDIFELSTLFPDEIGELQGLTFRFSVSEFRSMTRILILIEKHPAYAALRAAVDRLNHQPKNSPKMEILGEIVLHKVHLRPAIEVLADALKYHDSGRVENAA